MRLLHTCNTPRQHIIVESRELAQHRGTCQHRGDISVQPVWLVSQKCFPVSLHKVGVFSWNSLIMRHCACGPFPCHHTLSISVNLSFGSTLVHSDTHQNYQKKIVPCENLHMGRLLGPWRPDCTRSGFLNSFSRHVLFRNSNNVAPNNVSLVM